MSQYDDEYELDYDDEFWDDYDYGDEQFEDEFWGFWEEYL